jgi:hypothetical protein
VIIRYLPTTCGRVAQVQGDQVVIMTPATAELVMASLERTSDERYREFPDDPWDIAGSLKRGAQAVGEALLQLRERGVRAA